MGDSYVRFRTTNLRHIEGAWTTDEDYEQVLTRHEAAQELDPAGD
ncbi:hypothetical protein BH23ACT6_BH23ACT6_19610 [soil metagenome]